jgi:hypothetical protein
MVRTEGRWCQLAVQEVEVNWHVALGGGSELRGWSERAIDDEALVADGSGISCLGCYAGLK